MLLLLALPAFAQSNSLAAQRASIAKQKLAVSHLRPPASTPIFPVARFCPSVEKPALSRMIEAAASANEISPNIVREVARQESAFHPCAVSSKGAEGLMQLMPATQALLGVSDPFDPNESLMAGAHLLKDLLARYKGNLSLALSAYNAGTVRVDKIAAIPEIPETQNYVATILERLGQ
ncbi:MAG: lytic transglycosylase domain-containing protein [Acidobacteriota bacterium]